MPPSNRVSLRQIAREVGMSLGTVSRGLRDDPAIAVSTRETIKAAAQKLGYRPDAEMTRFLTAVRGTSARHSRETIAFLWTDPPGLHLHDNPFSRRLHLGARQRADELNLGCDEFFYDENPRTRRQLERVLKARGIRGLIVAPRVGAQGFELQLDLRALHVVAIGRSVTRPALHRAINDQFGILSLALHKLRELGYRRVGLACHQLEDKLSNRRISGAYHAFTLSEDLLVPLPIYHFNPAPDLASLGAWLDEHRPDCVLAPFDIRALLDQAPRRRRARPAFASFNVLPGDEVTTGVCQPYELLAAAAVDLLATSLAHHTAGVPAKPRQLSVAPDWQDGRTATPV